MPRRTLRIPVSLLSRPEIASLAAAVGSRREAVGLYIELHAWAAAHCDSSGAIPLRSGLLAEIAEASGISEQELQHCKQAGIFQIEGAHALFPLLKRRNSKPTNLDANPSEVVIQLPIRGRGKWYPVTQDQVEAWEKQFPEVNVLSALRDARAWLFKNQRKRKTARGMPRFIQSWLENCAAWGKNKKEVRARPLTDEEVEEYNRRWRLEGGLDTE